MEVLRPSQYTLSRLAVHARAAPGVPRVLKRSASTSRGRTLNGRRLPSVHYRRLSLLGGVRRRWTSLRPTKAMTVKARLRCPPFRKDQKQTVVVKIGVC